MSSSSTLTGAEAGQRLLGDTSKRKSPDTAQGLTDLSVVAATKLARLYQPVADAPVALTGESADTQTLVSREPQLEIKNGVDPPAVLGGAGV